MLTGPRAISGSIHSSGEDGVPCAGAVAGSLVLPNSPAKHWSGRCGALRLLLPANTLGLFADTQLEHLSRSWISYFFEVLVDTAVRPSAGRSLEDTYMKTRIPTYTYISNVWLQGQHLRHWRMRQPPARVVFAPALVRRGTPPRRTHRTL